MLLRLLTSLAFLAQTFASGAAAAEAAASPRDLVAAAEAGLELAEAAARQESRPASQFAAHSYTTPLPRFVGEPWPALVTWRVKADYAFE
jgi:poly(3-hydroxybutyrate) depolymerase